MLLVCSRFDEFVLFTLAKQNHDIDLISSSPSSTWSCGHAVRNNFIALSGDGVVVVGKTNLFSVLRLELVHKYINIIIYIIARTQLRVLHT